MQNKSNNAKNSKQVPPNVTQPLEEQSLEEQSLEEQSIAKTVARTSRKKSRVVARIGTLTAAIVSILFAAFLCLQTFLPSLSFNLFGFRAYLISYTASMEPTLSYYDMAFVAKCDINKLEEGDIITFFAHSLTSDTQMVVTHRIEKILTDDSGKRFLCTKGDARSLVDPIPVTQDGKDGTNILIGKFVFKSMVLGRIGGFLQSKYAIFALASTISGTALIIVLAKTGKQKDQ